MADPTIKVIPNGPYRVTGPTTITDPEGSVNKPYCDGTHSRIGFQAAEAAVKAQG